MSNSPKIRSSESACSEIIQSAFDLIRFRGTAVPPYALESLQSALVNTSTGPTTGQPIIVFETGQPIILSDGFFTILEDNRLARITWRKGEDEFMIASFYLYTDNTGHTFQHGRINKKPWLQLRASDHRSNSFHSKWTVVSW